MRTRRLQEARGLRSGLTLVEAVTAATLLGALLGSIALVTDTSNRTYVLEAVDSHLEARAAITLDQVVRELRAAGEDTFNPDPGAGGSSDVSYLQAESDVPGVVTWSLPRTLQFQYELGELDDGLDNNDNGLVDEGRLVLITDVGGAEERSRVFTHWVSELAEDELPNGLDDNGNGLVDEPGFVVERNGTALTVHLSLARRLVDGRVVTISSRTTVQPRNRFEPKEDD